MTLSDSEGLPLINVKALPVPTNLPTGLTFPVGQFSYQVNNVPVGGTVNLSIYVDSSINVQGYWKLNQQTNQWESIATKTETVGNKTRIDFAIQANHAPAVAHELADQTASQGQAFSSQVPADAFADADPDDTLRYAALGNGAALPAWLAFDPATRTFSGTPHNADVGRLDLQVTAIDPAKAVASDTFGLVVSNVNGGAGKDIYRYLASQFGLDDLAAGSHDTIKATKGDTLAFDAGLWARLTQNGAALDDLAGKGLLKQIDADTNIAYGGHSLMLDLNGDGLFQAGQDMSIDLMGVHKVGVDAAGQFLVMS